MSTRLDTTAPGERWLVIGGSGFIGRELCRQLLNASQHVIVLTRDVNKARRLLPASVELSDRLELVHPVDVVVNLAGESLAAKRWTAARKQILIASRVDTSVALNRWIGRLERPPRVIVSGSAIGWYGSTGDEPLDENAPAGIDFAARLCGAWEAAADDVPNAATRVVRLRTGLVLSRGGGALQKMMRLFKLGLGGKIGSGRQWMSWVHLEDIARLVIWLATSPQAKGAYNGTAPLPVTNEEFSQTLARELGRPCAVTTPAAALRLLLGEMASIVTTGQRVLPQRALKEGFTFRYATLADALHAELVRGIRSSR